MIRIGDAIVFLVLVGGLLAGCGAASTSSTTGPASSTPGLPSTGSSPAASPRAIAENAVPRPVKTTCSRDPYLFWGPPASLPAAGGPVGRLLAAAYDARVGRILSIWADDEYRQAWTFDVCSNEWRLWSETALDGAVRAGDPPSLPPDLRSLVFDVDSNLSVGVDSSGRVWSYTSLFNEWEQLDASARGGTLVYDPTTGLVVAFRLGSPLETRVWTYEVESGTWMPIVQADVPDWGRDPDHVILAYDRSVERVVANQGGRSWTFDPRTGRWQEWTSPSLSIGTGYWASGGEMAHDTAREQVVAFGDGRVIAYRAATEDTETLFELDMDRGPVGPQARMMHWFVYDPIHARFVMTGGGYRAEEGSGDTGVGNDVWAFDPATAAWTQLATAATRPTRLADTEGGRR